MADDLDFFLSPDDQRNFALLVEGTKVYVCREYLACWSPVFAKIFFPEGAPFQQPEGGMEMKEKRLEGFLIFLRFLCPSPQYNKMKISNENVAPLLAYAEEYDVGMLRLRERCVDFMDDQLQMGDLGDRLILIDYLHLASIYNLKELQTQLIPLVGRLPFCKIKTAHTTLPAPVLAAVYQAKALQATGGVEGCCDAAANQLLAMMPIECWTCEETCKIWVDGKSSCCSACVVVLGLAAVEALHQCAFVCSNCSKPCALSLDEDDGYMLSSCCKDGVFVYPKCDACKQQPVGAATSNVGFSADLLDKMA